MKHIRNTLDSRLTLYFKHRLGRVPALSGTSISLILVVSGAFAADLPTDQIPVAGERDALRASVAQTMVEETRPPIGAIIAYWGTTNGLAALKGWELCDGTQVLNQDSPLRNMHKPNLVDRFVMGCAAMQDPQATRITGGTNVVPSRAQGSTGGVALDLIHLPAHSHPHRHNIAVSGSSGAHYLGDSTGESILTGGERGGDSKYALASVAATPNAGPTSTDSAAAGGGQPHAHSLPALPEEDNRPAFVGLYYIMRVK